MRGVILAGGLGTRLRPVTAIYNKHLVLVYDKPMIYYPIWTLKDSGITDIVLVSGGEHIGGFAELLGSGAELGVKLTYRVQEKAGGIAEALSCVEGLVEGAFAVILGDNYFSELDLNRTKPTIFVKAVSDPQRFGVYANGVIKEKPETPASDQAVTGAYVYDEAVFDFIRTLQPSARGELEVTDVNNWYLGRGMQVIDVESFWSDMGTFNSLLEVANYVQP